MNCDYINVIILKSIFYGAGHAMCANNILFFYFCCRWVDLFDRGNRLYGNVTIQMSRFFSCILGIKECWHVILRSKATRILLHCFWFKWLPFECLFGASKCHDICVVRTHEYREMWHIFELWALLCLTEGRMFSVLAVCLVCFVVMTGACQQTRNLEFFLYILFVP